MVFYAGRIELESEDRARLEEMVQSRTLASRLVLRAKIHATMTLARADQQEEEIAAQHQVLPPIHAISRSMK